MFLTDDLVYLAPQSRVVFMEEAVFTAPIRPSDHKPTKFGADVGDAQDDAPLF